MKRKKFNAKEKIPNKLLGFIESTTELPKKQIAERLFITRQLYNWMRKQETHKMPVWRQWQIKYEFSLTDDTFLRLTEVSQKLVAQNSRGYHLESDVGTQIQHDDQ